VASRHLPFGKITLSFLRRGRRRAAQLPGGSQGGPQPARGVRVAQLHGAGQRAARLRQPVLEVAPGPADLPRHQVRGLVQQVLAGAAAAQLAGELAADSAGEQFGLAGRVGGGVEEAAVLGKPAARVRHGQLQAEQLGRRITQFRERCRQAGRQPGVGAGQPLLDGVPPPRTPGIGRADRERDQALPALALDLIGGGGAQLAFENVREPAGDVASQPRPVGLGGVVEVFQQPGALGAGHGHRVLASDLHLR
jgi:hypothetical protein